MRGRAGREGLREGEKKEVCAVCPKKQEVDPNYFEVFPFSFSFCCLLLACLTQQPGNFSWTWYLWRGVHGRLQFPTCVVLLLRGWKGNFCFFPTLFYFQHFSSLSQQYSRLEKRKHDKKEKQTFWNHSNLYLTVSFNFCIQFQFPCTRQLEQEQVLSCV